MLCGSRWGCLRGPHRESRSIAPSVPEEEPSRKQEPTVPIPADSRNGCAVQNREFNEPHSPSLKFAYRHTPGLAEFPESLNASLLVSTYQALMFPAPI